MLYVVRAGISNNITCFVPENNVLIFIIPKNLNLDYQQSLVRGRYQICVTMFINDSLLHTVRIGHCVQAAGV